MNIFCLHEDPKESAKMMCDKHVVKMILESAQLLCTAHRELDVSCNIFENIDKVLYKSTHKNHPSAKWVRESVFNYRWLYLHMMALGDEYTKRYGKTHLTITKCAKFLNVPPVHMQGDEWSEPPQAMPDNYKVEGDSIKAYWNYYIGEKHNIANKKTEKIYT